VASVLVHICESNKNIFYFMLKLNFIHFPRGEGGGGGGVHNTKQWDKIWNIYLIKFYNFYIIFAMC